MSHSLEQINAARKGVIRQSASSKPLTSCLKGYSFQLVFQSVFPAYTLQLAATAICVLHPDLKNFCSNKSKRALRALLTGTSWDISNKPGGTSALRTHLSTSLDVNKANGMLASNAQRIFCHNVTCFRTNNCCSNRSHLPEYFNKAAHFLPAGLLCFFTSQHTRLPWL